MNTQELIDLIDNIIDHGANCVQMPFINSQKPLRQMLIEYQSLQYKLKRVARAQGEWSKNL